MEKLWSGRFEKENSELMDDFNSSIHFDKRLYNEDIIGSIAHINMLGKQNIIPTEEADLIKKELNSILEGINNNKIELDPKAEDIHMNIEKILIDRIGDVGKKMHTGRSRNDQVALDMRMYVKKEIITIQVIIVELQKTLLNIAEKHIETIMPGYTHLQRAQPISFAHHILAYFEMFKRDMDRLEDTYKRTNIMPLGSGALATTTYPLNREMVAKELDFDDISYNSLDAVSDRDFCIELASSLSILMMHLSRFCEEIILWNTQEFQFIEIDDTYSTGSSIMPQKKNPDAAELIRGKTGRVYGNLISLLTTMKSLPLAYNKDMQEDKEPIFDAIDTVKKCLYIFKEMMATMRINKENMEKATKKGFTNATDAADYLVKKGIPFRDAHEIIGKLVLYCIKNNMALDEISINEYKNINPIFENDIYSDISVKVCVEKRNNIGGPSKNEIKRAIIKGQEYIEKKL